MCRIISIVNMKGGVGKSTTAVYLGIGLAKQGKKVLLLDCDSQGSLTASLGFRKPSLLDRHSHTHHEEEMNILTTEVTWFRPNAQSVELPPMSKAV